MSGDAPLLVHARSVAPPTDRVVAKLDDPIERTIEELRQLSRTSALQFAIQVGTIIVERFYGSDPEQWRRRGPKHASFRKLAAHPSLPFSPGALYRAVAIYELTRRLAGQESVRHLGCSHLRAVLGLRADEQSRLLDLAYGKRWTVEQLAARFDEVGQEPMPILARLREMEQAAKSGDQPNK